VQASPRAFPEPYALNSEDGEEEELCLSLFELTQLVSLGSLSLQSRRICVAHPACEELADFSRVPELGGGAYPPRTGATLLKREREREFGCVCVGEREGERERFTHATKSKRPLTMYAVESRKPISYKSLNSDRGYG